MILQGGDLRQAISTSSSGKFGWYEKGRRVALDVSKGLHFLHSNNVIHRYASGMLGLYVMRER